MRVERVIGTDSDLARRQQKLRRLPFMDQSIQIREMTSRSNTYILTEQSVVLGGENYPLNLFTKERDICIEK